MDEDIFNHLIDVEGEAANMLFEAQVEADEKIASTKKLLDDKYKALSDAIIKDMDSLFEEQKKEVDLLAKKELEDYKEKIHKHPLDYEAFAKRLDAYFSI